MREVFLYGAGVPRYLAVWLPLAPLLVGLLLAVRVRRDVVAWALATTLPTFLLHNPPYALPLPLRWALLVAVAGFVTAWLAARVRAPAVSGPPPGREPMRWGAVAAIALVALSLRAPLAWADPGISDFATATETAARQLAAGTNPWTLPNPYATVGTYQYPIATPVLSLPFVLAVPDPLLGEEHVGARAAIWAIDVAAIVLLAWAGARWGRARAGLLAAGAYALHPTLVRESGIVVANDLMLAAAAAGVAVALAVRRPYVAAALVGLAVSIKPSAAVLGVLLLAAEGLRPTLVAAALPILAQVPFLLWPRPGLWGVAAIAEPLTRAEPALVLELSGWWPVYALAGALDGPPDALVGDIGPLLDVLGAVAVLAGLAVAAWAGRRLRRDGADPARAAAAVAVALVVPFLLATVQRTNYQDWYLTPALLAAALVGLPRPGGAGDDAADQHAVEGSDLYAPT